MSEVRLSDKFFNDMQRQWISRSVMGNLCPKIRKRILVITSVLCSPKTVGGLNRLGWGDHYWLRGLRRQNTGILCAVLSPLSRLVGRQFHRQRPQHPLNRRLRVVGGSSGKAGLWPQEGWSQWMQIQRSIVGIAIQYEQLIKTLMTVMWATSRQVKRSIPV